MKSKINEHVFPKKGGWNVRREGSNKTSRLFRIKKEAMEYAGIIAASDKGYVVSHKRNGQFRKFKSGRDIYVEPHKIGPIITGTVNRQNPIVNNKEPVIQKMNLI